MLLGSDNSNNSNNNEEKLLNGSSSGHQGLFGSNNSDIDINEADDLVPSSFAISFKANDPVNTVSEKLKEQDSLNKFDDEFDNFEFDASINPFKPAAQNNADKTSPIVNDMPAIKPEEITNADIRVPNVDTDVFDNISKEPSVVEPAGFPSVPAIENNSDSNLLFENDDPDLKAFANTEIENSNIFNAGNELDFASSGNSSSTFAAIEPMADVVSPTATDMNSPIEYNQPVNDSSTIQPVIADIDTTPIVADIPAQPVVEDIIQPVVDNTVTQAIPSDSGNFQTYGQVTTGVNAFGKRNSRKPDNNEVNSPKEPIANNQPVNQNDQTTAAPVAAVTAPVAPVAPVKPVAPQPANRPAANTRPAANANSPFAPKGNTKPQVSTRGPRVNKTPAVPAANSQHQQTSIQPVTTVNNKKKKKKEKKTKEKNGIGGVVTLIVVLLFFLGLIWFLDNFGGKKSSLKDDAKTTKIESVKSTSTKATKETTEESESELSVVVTESEETTTEATTKETTETTTEATTTTEETTVETTEATTEATTTEETTVETTTEATTTTEETTTVATTTTEASTTASTTKPQTAGTVTTFYTRTTNFKQLETGFSFDLVLENYGDTNADLNDSINSISITLRANSTIVSVKCPDINFTLKDSGRANTYSGVPSGVIVPAGETYTITITVTTEEHVNSYGVSSYYIDWNA